ncbi:MAG: S-methyl-5-thioribose-1-phosphate isomerase [Candidatus Heimdallarchaeota archaeon]|nr:S-methyl-5-thioribose-1-phosphate isomerase [Candidatus Heimdallarchaeota archaeon]
MKELQKVADEIISLNIQGATAVAVEGIKALGSLAKRLPEMSEDDFLKQIETARDILYNTRPTEPALRNGLRKILYELHHKSTDSTDEMRQAVINTSDEYLNLLKSTKEKIIETGAHLIQDDYTVMTHCHSSITSAIFVRAHELGKNIRAICTETRPRYQGRKTAMELVEAGIPTIQVVDSGMRWIARRESIDLIMIGLDAVTSQGTVLNKIGSRLLALAAKESDIPLYVAGPLLKFDSDTVFGSRTIIEMRDEEEILADWKNAPKGLKVLNPAFESVSRDLIDAMITEAGVFPPTLVYKIVRDEYPWMVFD